MGDLGFEPAALCVDGAVVQAADHGCLRPSEAGRRVLACLAPQGVRVEAAAPGVVDESVGEPVEVVAGPQDGGVDERQLAGENTWPSSTRSAPATLSGPKQPCAPTWTAC